MNNHIKLAIRETESVAVVTLDRMNSGANIFDVETLNELNQTLDAIPPGIRGVVFISAKNSIFIAGADINQLANVKSEAELLDIVKLGQQVFNRIAAMPAVTVAAIHGAALGGGCELTLACDYRIASGDRATQIGLPETSLGILPCWGGASRLPRLIGLPRALDAIMNGKKFAAVPALKAEIVDEIIPREHLLRFALDYVTRGKPHRKSHALTNNPLVASFIAKRARAAALKKTHGHYPAITTALDMMIKGVSVSLDESLKLEQNAIAALSKTDACKNLIRIFGLQDRAKKLGKTKVPPAQRVAVIGAGVMGSGIAQWISSREIAVTMRDVNAEQVRKGMANAAKLFADAAKKHVIDATAAKRGLDRITPATSEVSLQHFDFVIEAAIEQMDAKKKIFARLAEISGPQTILATNTSALSITEIAAATKSPERVIGIHFFNPVHKMQLVEIVVGKTTAPETVERTIRFVQQLGKLPVIAQDSPGFIVNRILLPYLVEAGLLFEQGASVADLDAAMLDFGMPMGPMRLLDEVGIDVGHHVAAELSAAFGARMPVPDVLDAMMKAGLLGRKNGKGFYLHSASGEPTVNEAVRALVSADRLKPELQRSELAKRMVLLMVNEAARCLEEKVAAESADVDFGMIMGTGFAPFRGGPLRYADSIGIAKVHEELAALAKSDSRFEPAKLIVEMANAGRGFYS